MIQVATLAVMIAKDEVVTVSAADASVVIALIQVLLSGLYSRRHCSPSPTDRPTNRPGYRDARTHLKMVSKEVIESRKKLLNHEIDLK